jgi:hypothetical protein
MKPTLESGWSAFATDLYRRPQSAGDSKATHRQAFKNGAAFILARALLHGLDALPQSDLAAMQFLAPRVDLTRDVHPEWTDLHADCVIAGGLTALTLLHGGRTPAEVKKEIEGFEL